MFCLFLSHTHTLDVTEIDVLSYTQCDRCTYFVTHTHTQTEMDVSSNTHTHACVCMHAQETYTDMHISVRAHTHTHTQGAIQYTKVDIIHLTSVRPISPSTEHTQISIATHERTFTLWPTTLQMHTRSAWTNHCLLWSEIQAMDTQFWYNAMLQSNMDGPVTEQVQR